MNAAFIEIKEELKFLAKEIKRIRAMRKDIPNEEFDTRSEFDYRLYRLRWDFRTKHIALSLVRGTSKELIESDTKNIDIQNQAFFTADRIKREYESRIREYEDAETLLSSS